MSKSPQSRRTRIVRIAATAVVTLVLAGLVGTALVRAWRSADSQSHQVALERRGIAYVQQEVRLLGALAAGESQVARGGRPNAGPIRAAETAVDAAGTDDALQTTGRWSELRGRIDALLQQPGTGPGAVQGWTDAVGLAGNLLDAVVGFSGLDLDPDADSHSLIEAAAHSLPAVVIYAGRAGDIAAAAIDRTPSTTQETALSVAVYQVALASSQLDAQLIGGVTGGAGVAPDLATQEDAFQSAISSFAPPSVVVSLSGPVDLVGLRDNAQIVQAAALTLTADLLTRVDDLFAARQTGLRGDEEFALVVGAAVLLSTVALIWLLTQAPRRVSEADVEDGPAPGAGRDEQADPTTLIDARALLLEELVHIGRGVRMPAQGSGDDAQ